MTGVACILLDYTFLWLVSDEVDAKKGRTAFFADFYVAVNAVSLVMLLFGSGRLISRIGVTLALLSVPLALAGGGLWLLARPSLAAMCVIRVVKDGLVRTMFEPATERVMMRAAGARYDTVRTVLGGLGFSLGMGLAAILVIALTFGLDASRSAVVACLLGAVGVWVVTIELERRAGRASKGEAAGEAKAP